MANKNDKSTWFDWSDNEALAELVALSSSKKEVLQKMGYNPRSAASHRKLSEALVRFSIPIAHFKKGIANWHCLPDIVPACRSIGEVLEAVGLTNQGSNYETAKLKIASLELDISHFEPRGGYTGKERKILPDHKIFVKNSPVSRQTAKNRILRDSLLEHKCAKCGNDGEWIGDPLVLQLEHKNGVNNDHRLENLEFLCPNCHSQTPTFSKRK